jgi:hypothetical protein
MSYAQSLLMVSPLDTHVVVNMIVQFRSSHRETATAQPMPTLPISV